MHEFIHNHGWFVGGCSIYSCPEKLHQVGVPQNRQNSDFLRDVNGRCRNRGIITCEIDKFITCKIDRIVIFMERPLLICSWFTAWSLLPYVCMYVCMFFVCEFAFLCTYVRTYMCVCVCMYVYIYIHIYIYIYTHT
jgi:hypothetical protein